MKTQSEVRTYAVKCYNEKSIYVWGMNSGTIISRATIDDAYKHYHTAKYDKTYYENKLKEGAGHNGSDCSGLLYPLSGSDNTAQGYFNGCTKTGGMTTLPLDKVTLVFGGSSKTSITHVGIYLGDGRVMHMQSSVKNAVLHNVTEYPWKFWGIPKWIDYEAPFESYTANYTSDKFIADVAKALGCMTYSKLLAATITVSKTTNISHTVVTALERCLKRLGYYTGAIEADNGKKPVFGSGMEQAVKTYQKDVVKATAKNTDGVISAKGATWKKLLTL